MTLMTFDPITGELVDFATPPLSPNPGYAAEFLVELKQAPTPPLGSKAMVFMEEVWDILHEQGFC